MIDLHLSQEQLHELQNLLAGKKLELTVLVKSLGEVTGTKHDCRILDIADSASLNEMRRRAATLINQHEGTIAEIDAAVNRIKAGRFGFSETTGEPISYERLLIIPWARSGAGD